MTNKPESNRIAYRCPDCGTVIHGMVGKLHANLLRIKCPCQKSALDVTLGQDKKVRFSVPCLYCKQNHSYVVSESIVFGRDRFVLACPYSRMDIGFLGSEDKVAEELSRTEEELSRLLVNLEAEELSDIQPVPMNDEEILPDPEVYDIVRFLVRELEADGAIDCPCHGGRYEFRFTDTGVEVYCEDCGASYVFAAESVAVAREYLDVKELKLT